MIRLPWSVPSALLLAATLGGCASAGPDGAMAPATSDWPDSRWRLAAVVDAKGVRTPVPADMVVDLAFDATASRVSGYAGCNHYSAGVTVDGARLTFGPAAASKRLCPGPAMAVESAFLAALAQVAVARIEGDRLALSGSDGTLRLDLVRTKPE
jgi:heat shock protein HslJ